MLQSSKDIISTIKSAVICIVETYLSKRDKISFEGYQCFSLIRVSEGEECS